MLESIYVGMTGLLGYSRGLRVIANNTANINTPGFKSSSLQFADLSYAGGNVGGGVPTQNSGQLGFGITTTGTTISFKQGELRQTGEALDMAVDGQGMFVLKGADGSITYTRDGQFEFNTDGILVMRNSTEKVMGLDERGNLVEISLSGRMANAGKSTSVVNFSGNLSSTATEQLVGGVKVIDATGGEHVLSLKLTNGTASAATDAPAVEASEDADEPTDDEAEAPATPAVAGDPPGTWTVQVLDGTTVVGEGKLRFVDGKPVVDANSITFSYAPSGQTAVSVNLKFSTDVTSFAAGNLSTLAMSTQDGVGPGNWTSVQFDGTGVLTTSYSNGQQTKSTRLAMARFDSANAVGAIGNNQFAALDASSWHMGWAGDSAFGTVRSGVVEIPNVDLSQEFSDLVIMQRGYQASSQVISTANDMLQELFSMKSR